jgi:hypothetical protein
VPQSYLQSGSLISQLAGVAQSGFCGDLAGEGACLFNPARAFCSILGLALLQRLLRLFSV